MHVLVISPHPDDESIGCGGTICKHVGDGDEVRVVFLTSGEKGGNGRPEQETIAVREQEARNAAEVLGIAEIEFFHLPDGAVSATPEAVSRLKGLLQTWRPNVVYAPHRAETHADHRAAVNLLEAALTEAGQSETRVLMYEVWTPLQHMDEIVDITSYASIKRQAIRAYRSQCDLVDFEAAALGLNRYRGEMHSWPHGQYAEVFSEMRLNNAVPSHHVEDSSATG